MTRTSSFSPPFVCVSAVTCLVLLAGQALAAEINSRPNLLFIISDDQSFETLGRLQHLDIETPHLDQLARRGTSFSHCYNMGSWSGAVCIASRTMLNTGRFLWNANDVKSTLAREHSQGKLWPDMLKSAGYRTYLTGKWHVSIKPEEIFDVVRHVRPGMPSQTPAGYHRPPVAGPDPWLPWDTERGGFWEGGKHWSEVVADDAIDFLTEAASRSEPFFMYVAFNAPHDPRQAPKEFVDRYPIERIATPENFLPEYPHKERIGCGTGLRDEQLAPFPRSEDAIKIHRREYYACITHLDQQIGRILDALDEANLDDSTWIVFTSDHGLAVGRHGLVGKQNMYEHSVRVPFIIAGPQAEPNVTISTPIYLQDAVPTTLQLAGVTPPEHVEFKSVLPLLARTPKQALPPNHYETIYGAYLDKQRMINDGQWKLIVYPDVPIYRLFDLKKDPFEKSDLAHEPSQLTTTKRLFRDLIRWQEQHGDPLDLKSIFPELLN